MSANSFDGTVITENVTFLYPESSHSFHRSWVCCRLECWTTKWWDAGMKRGLRRGWLRTTVICYFVFGALMFMLRLEVFDYRK
jgi:hypothetical protein